MAAGFVLFRYLPLRARVDSVKQRKTAELIALNKSRSENTQLPELQALVSELRESIGDYETRIPRQSDIGVFLRKIAELMKEHNLREQVVEPGAQIESEKLTCIPVSMRCNGELTELFAFFRKLQGLDRLVRIEQVKLTNDADFGGEVRMETKAVIYYGGQAEQG